MTSIGKNTFLNIAGMIVPAVIGVFSTPFAYKGLGEEQFGILLTVFLFIGGVSLFDMGLSRAVTKYVNEVLVKKQYSYINVIVGTSVSIQLLIGGVIALSFSVLTPYLVSNVFNIPLGYIDIAEGSFYICALTIPFVIVANTYRGVLEASSRFDLVNLVKVIFSSVTYLAPLIVLFSESDLVDVLWVVFIIKLMQLFVSLVFCKLQHCNISLFPVFSQKCFRRMLGFSGWVAATNIISFFQENLEKFLLASMMPISLLTYYMIPKDVLERVFIVTGGMVSAIFPEMNNAALHSKSKLKGVYDLGINFILIACFIILFPIAIFSEFLLTLWIDFEFAQNTKDLIVILVLGVTASSLNLLLLALFQAEGRPDITTKGQLIRLPIILGLSVILISSNGLFGAALSWSIGRSLALLMNVYSAYYFMSWSLQDVFNHKHFVGLLGPSIVIYLSDSLVISLGNDIVLRFILFLILFYIVLKFYWRTLLTEPHRNYLIQHLNKALHYLPFLKLRTNEEAGKK
ncbi:oligosaccharide flippase family protein [Vibrio nigripulchritudo]|uniref:oligosaccharide flippase family protein n=1 Tax=Vibrio nigripulchritudo TaxID=28173 RepID=UPI0024938B09|nr:polysaccharide biosynthesis C-terminal domain-containing protein [Vibrio nigripulchritudo]BDU38869.1 putative O-antigen transporter [Vibrio nigripulchritudo]BDU44589.1 putative O-antigen transporter [Vibrio nigripulchritudo]